MTYVPGVDPSLSRDEIGAIRGALASLGFELPVIKEGGDGDGAWWLLVSRKADRARRAEHWQRTHSEQG